MKLLKSCSHMYIGYDEVENSSFSHLHLALVGPNVCGGLIRPCRAGMSGGVATAAEAFASMATGAQALLPRRALPCGHKAVHDSRKPLLRHAVNKRRNSRKRGEKRVL